MGKNQMCNQISSRATAMDQRSMARKNRTSETEKWLPLPLLAGVAWAPHGGGKGLVCVCVCMYVCVCAYVCAMLDWSKMETRTSRWTGEGQNTYVSWI